MVTAEGQAMTQVKAPMVQVNADGMLTLKGGITMIN
jgi:type VI secretion system secreted protein VgrG